MNFAYLHLILNHVPIVGLPLMTIIFAYAEFKGIAALKKFMFLMLFTVSALTIPVYYSGEWSEDTVEKYSNVSESIMEEHEDAAKISLILAILTSLAAMTGLLIKQVEYSSKITKILITLALLTTLSFGYTGYWGGKIRRPELRQNSINANPTVQEKQHD